MTLWAMTGLMHRNSVLFDHLVGEL